ncbi:MAG TPA: hypothetical protein VF759_10965 [Allosphingosinicella sp.]|jgi:hypothetical protein
MRLLPLLLLTACAAGPAGEADLSEELAGRSAGPPQDCVPASTLGNLAPRDSMTLAYRSGDTIWLNRLAATCPALRPTSTLIVEAHGSQYCRGDRFRTVEPGQSIPGGSCVLGPFTPWRR